MNCIRDYFLDRLGIELSDEQNDLFIAFEELLLEWNEKINLTAIRDREGIRIKHFLDSGSCLRVMDNTSIDRVIDVGTGGGFPGIPLKILSPEIKLTLVDSVGKKTRFLSLVCDTLGFTNVDVITMRAEEIGRLAEHRERYDWAIARALAPMPVLSEYLLPLVKVGGFMLAQKGSNAENEVQESKNAIGILGGKLKTIKPVTLDESAESHNLVVLEKIKPTSDIYPRPVGIPSRKPI
ncbi:MAG: 16S rRNA (guanine(527)-N(7))-methyltransferase RsmG [Anaerolineales bacterium]|nr:16S rRNA (guanine(527)-N(7))-methyltransferase RsmG [Anaerolineales bacterium]